MRPLQVLVVDTDLDRLEGRARALVALGHDASVAMSVDQACVRARALRFDVVLAPEEVIAPADGSLGLADALSVELAEPPRLVVLLGAGSAEELPEGALAALASSRAPTPDDTHPRAARFAGVKGMDLILSLALERRSGTLSVTTDRGAGELRLVDGGVVDAVFLRVEGPKAVARVIDATRSPGARVLFVEGTPPVLPRIYAPTRDLLRAITEEEARVAPLRAVASHLARGALVARPEARPSSSRDRRERERSSTSEAEARSGVASEVLARLRAPCALDALLDALPRPDSEILEALVALDAAGRVARLDALPSRALLDPGALAALRAAASAARSRARGFAGPPRVVFAGTAQRLAFARHALLSLADAVTTDAPDAADSSRLAAHVPYVMAELRLGEGMALEVVGLPLVPAFAPLWPLAVAGAPVVVSLERAAVDALAEACASVGVRVVDAEALADAPEELSAPALLTLLLAALGAEPSAPAAG